MNFLEVLVLSFIEGLTEFLPVSSTGHLIITSALFKINEEGFVKNFNIIIQFGAILSVLVLYRKLFYPIRFEFYKKLFLAFLPAAFLGVLVKDKIDIILGSVTVVTIALILGGIILIFTDKIFAQNESNIKKIDHLSWQECLYIGLFQCIAFIPGISRAAATIIGAQAFGLNKKDATEFSFFLAMPTLTGAALLKGIGIIKTIEPQQVITLVVGTVLSFIFALITIKFFIKIVTSLGFKYFGIYRIILGLVILFFIK